MTKFAPALAAAFAALPLVLSLAAPLSAETFPQHGQPIATPAPDPAIARAIAEISPEKIQADIEKLVTFKNRSTLLLNQFHGSHGRVFWMNNYKEKIIENIDELKECLAFMKIRAK